MADREAPKFTFGFTANNRDSAGLSNTNPFSFPSHASFTPAPTTSAHPSTSVDGDLTERFDKLSVRTPATTDSTMKASPAAAMDPISKSVGDALNDEEFSDLEIRCKDGRRFNVHRMVVCRRSPILKAECSTGFKDGAKQVISHEVFDSDTMGCMIRFMYKSVYDCPEKSASAADPKMQVDVTSEKSGASVTEPSRWASKCVQHIAVYAIAAFYELPELEELALENIAKLSKAAMHLEATELIRIITAVHDYELDESVVLRDKIWRLAVERGQDCVKDDDFVQAILERTDIRPFANHFIKNMMKSMEHQHQSEREEHDKKVAELVNSREAVKEYYRKALEEGRVEKVQALAKAEDKIGVEQALAKKSSQEAAGLRAKIAILDKDLRTSKAETTSAQAEAASAKAEAAAERAVKEQLLDLNDYDQCKRCKRDFCVYFERHGPTGYMAVCVYCNWRHYKGKI